MHNMVVVVINSSLSQVPTPGFSSPKYEILLCVLGIKPKAMLGKHSIIKLYPHSVGHILNPCWQCEFALVNRSDSNKLCQFSA